MDFELVPDEQDVVDGLVEAVRRLSWDEANMGRTGRSADPEVVRQLVETLQAGGWMSLPAEAVSMPCLVEGAKQFHRKVVHPPAPLLESWLAHIAANHLVSAPEPDCPVAGPGSAADGDAGLLGDLVTSLSLDDALVPGPHDPGMVRTGRLPAGCGPRVMTVQRHPSAAPGGACVLVAEVADLDTRALVDIDATASAVTLHSPPARWRHLGDLDQAGLDAVAGRALCLTSGALVGQAQALLATSLDYVRYRKQFGVPVGSFQALKHRAANAHVELHTADLISRAAAWSVEHLGEPLPLCHMAKASAGTVALSVAQEAVQFHGGIGFTWEAGIHFGVRRCTELCLAGSSVAESWTALGEWALAQEQLLWPGDLHEGTRGKPA